LVGLAALSVGLYLILLGRLPGAGELLNRLSLLRDGLLLARNYPFTGAGLDMFEMQFSIYTLLIHVGYIMHSHNLLVDVLINQGLIGLLSFVGLAAACGVYGLRRLREATGKAAWIIEAGLVSLGVILAHGLGDDALYGNRGVLLLFVPIGWILCGANNARPERPATRPRDRRHWLGLGLAAAAGLVVIGLAIWRPVLGEWYANLGAIEQARVELSHYDQWHFDNPTMDQVRQRENLDAAGAWLRQAVALDPANATARQRLTEIELARGQYVEALQDIEFIYRAGEQDAVTRMLLGDAYAANGQVQAAVEVVRGLPWAIARLEGQAWSRYWVNADYRRAADAWAAVVLLDPNNTGAAQSQAEAARRAAQK
jgi:tetratricopeptide (TPR) repeat protein